MTDVVITTDPGTNIVTRLDYIYACCISPKFNKTTPRIFVASSPPQPEDTTQPWGGFIVRYADYNGTFWSTTFTSISESRLDNLNQGWTAITSTADGTKVIVAGLKGYIYMTTWNTSTLSYSAFVQVASSTFVGFPYSGIKTTTTGSRLVVAATGGTMWFAAWDGTSNYGTPTRITVTSSSTTSFAMSTDGSKIVYAGTDNKLYMLTWNGNTYTNNVQISTYTPPSSVTVSYRALEFSGDTRVLYATTNNSNTISYFVWDKTAQNYNERKTYIAANMPAAIFNKTAISIINPSRTRSKLYIIDCFNNSQNRIYNYNVTIYAPTPIYDVSFDIPNTKTLSLGTLQVSINDHDNSIINNLYYYYSMDGNVFSNSKVLADSGESPYTFTILTQDISNTIYVKVADTIKTSVVVYSNTIVSGNTTVYGNTTVDGNTTVYGNTTVIMTNTIVVNANTIVVETFGGNTSNVVSISSVIVYQQPRKPPIFNVSLVGSGNLQVTVGEIDTPNTIPDYYYLNNISYVAYLYSGTIDYSNSINYYSNNINYYTTNVGNLSSTNTQYGNVVSYLTGLPANKYTVYLAAKNDFGASTYGDSYGGHKREVIVYTIPPYPPVIDTQNTQSATPGNLTISIIDTNNSATNAIYYLYSLDGGITYGNSGVTHNGNTRYTFTVSDTGNAAVPLIGNTYTLSILASNHFGNIASSPATVTVYTRPDAPTIWTVPQNRRIEVSFETPNNRGKEITGYKYSVDGGNVYSAVVPFPTANLVSLSEYGGNVLGGNVLVNTFRIYNAVNGREYPIHVKTTNSIGDSVASNRSYAIPRTIPDEPDIVNVQPTDGGVDIVFSAPANTGGNAITAYKCGYVLGRLTN
jgi:hypothetical protein